MITAELVHFYDGVKISSIELDGTLVLADGRTVTRKERVKAEKDLLEMFYMLVERD